jgi:hypothetical protein
VRGRRGRLREYSNHLPPDKGTIMSYCHLIGGVANGIRLDFHSVCVLAHARHHEQLRAVPHAGATAEPGGDEHRHRACGCRGPASPSSGVTGYSVYRSRLPLDLGAPYIGHTPASPFDTPGLGTYYYRMRALRAADSSSFSGELKATACAFNAASPVIGGLVPHRGEPRGPERGRHPGRGAGDHEAAATWSRCSGRARAASATATSPRR